MDIKKNVENGMNAAIEHLEKELNSIRTGRANPAILDGVRVSVYGTEMGIKDIASITAPEPRTIQITLFDKSNVDATAKAIQTSDLGMMPNVDGSIIRITIPAMDQDQRVKMAKKCHEFGEQGKISIRHERAEGNKTARKEKADGNISEDLEKKLEKEIQDLTDKYCKKCDELTKAKEKEIMTI
ncbi:MAG: ribosome recycling factor [Chlamydiales bacterium]|nr:ribosome recycling factor [Chlamydiia bacterium]MCP5507516.1 ribosome recycling factor [Chlamydiales bacterium]